MKRRSLFLGGAAIAAAGFVVGALVGTTQAGDQEMDPDAMMKAWMEYATPGEHHEKLARSVGTWNVKSKMWEYPGAEPQKSRGKAVYTSVLGDRFVVEKFTGEVPMGEEMIPFEGRNLIGYDNLQKKYIFAWADTFMTGIMTGSGTADASGKVITYYSDNMPNPMTGGFESVKSVDRWINDGRSVFEMYRKMPDGTWFKHMELVYTRVD